MYTYKLSLSKMLSRSSMPIYRSHESLVCVNSRCPLHLQNSAFDRQNKVIYGAKTVFLSVDVENKAHEPLSVSCHYIVQI